MTNLRADDPQNPEQMMKLMNSQVDITGAEFVDVAFSADRTVLWVNVNGICVLRVCRIRNLVEGHK